MRERFTKAFFAVSATAVTVGAGLMAGPAMAATTAPHSGPAVGPALATLDQGGYQMNGNGRQFRWISSQLEVPDSPSTWHSQACTITAAPTHVVTFTGAASTPFTIVDTTRSVTLTEGTDYSVSPSDSPIALTGATITLIDSGHFKAGDVLTITATGATITGGTGTFTVPTPVATCTVAHSVHGVITVYDTNTDQVLYMPQDYAFTSGTAEVDLVASGNWAFGDVLHVLSGVFPSAYIQLSNGSLPNFYPGLHAGGQYVRTGVEPCIVAAQVNGYFNSLKCTTDDQWVAFFESFRNTLSSFPYFRHYIVLPVSVNPGDGVGFSLYYNVGGNELFNNITLPDGSSMEFQGGAHGAIFNYAAALVDFTNSNGGPQPLLGFGHRFTINLFLKGAVTTVNGTKGSFIGPWITNPVTATSNGLPWPAGALRVIPSPLQSDGFMANGAIRPWDAFAVLGKA